MADPTQRPDGADSQDARQRPQGAPDREGRGEERRQAPVPGLKDQDDETSDSYGNTRDSGETR